MSERTSSLHLISNRRLDNKFNIFEGIRGNLFFIGINLVTIGGQVIIVFVGGSALSAVRLNGTQWGISLLLGAISLPVAVLIRLIPNDFIRKFIPCTLNQNQTRHIGVFGDDRFERNDILKNIRQEPTFLKKIRSGRLNALMFKLRSSREHLLRSNGDSIPGTPNSEANRDAESPRSSWTRSRSNSGLGSAAVLTGAAAGSIAGWPPLERST